MSIFQNAINSIQIGVEDYESEDERRNIAAVRNIYAGVLLLYKEKLYRLSPKYDKELLIRKEILPVYDEEDNLVFEGKGKNTVDTFLIEKRFKSLKVKVDWKRFEEVRKLRNEMEHYFTTKSPDAIREIVSKSFLLIRDFLSNELNENPSEILELDCWNTLLETTEVYDAEVKECEQSLEKVDWKYETVHRALKELRCPECYSELIYTTTADDEYPEINLGCKSCHHEFNFIGRVELCVTESLAGDAFLSEKDGGGPIYGACNWCNTETFVHEEMCCVVCGTTLDYTHCRVCGEGLSLEEQDLEGFCSHCYHRMS